MTIADEIHARVKHLPEQRAREVLAFITDLETREKQHRASETSPTRRKLDHEIWSELLFGG